MTTETLSIPPSNGQLEALLDYLHERRNFDFRGYKRASLSRRIYKRMQAIGAEDYQRYIEILPHFPRSRMQACAPRRSLMLRANTL